MVGPWGLAHGWRSILTSLWLRTAQCSHNLKCVMVPAQVFFGRLSEGSRTALRLWFLTGDHIDAYEALRIGLVIKVVPADRLLDECFQIVERIALVPPETTKVNLQIATLGLEMMGLRDGLLLDRQLASTAHTMLREELRRPLDEARQEGGIKSYLRLRDGPFQHQTLRTARKKDLTFAISTIRLVE